MTAAQRIRVLIVDDSAMVRKVLYMGLSADPVIEVVGTASNADVAWKLMQLLRPDVVTLDLEMPGTDGLTFLTDYLPKMPVPTVVISSLTREGTEITLRAMEAGAVDVLPKPLLGPADGLPAILPEVCARVRAAATARVVPGRRLRMRPPAAAAMPSPAGGAPRGGVIAIGSSTGGVQALTRILPMFPADAPPILIVQHMPEGFTGPFAARLDALCALEVREARDGEVLQAGRVLIAPGGRTHMVIVRRGQSLQVELHAGDPVAFSRPSVDVLFASVARHAGARAAAAILTGMGRDGAGGLLAIRHAGGRTVAQDEATSVVYGMPMAAAEIGAAEAILPLEAIPARLLQSGPAAPPKPAPAALGRAPQ
jgi:two-component system chemotaxis response regulator CheB